GVDSETDGKVNIAAVAGSPSVCDPHVLVDCIETAFGTSFGQDECYGDADAGVANAPELPVCDLAKFDFTAYNCEATAVQVYLNVLIDWNQDGDWNDILLCASITRCAPEWAVKNTVILLPPGCTTQTTPQFRVGPRTGEGW